MPLPEITAKLEGFQLPEDYEILPSGDTYLTRNTRAMTHEKNLQLYVVRQSGKCCGIAAPSSIIQQVKADQQRRKEHKTITRTYKNHEQEFSTMAKELFPHMDDETVQECTQWAMKKGSGRVGRNKNLDLEDRVEFAVGDYVLNLYRHRLLGIDVSWRDATAAEQHRASEVMEDWRTGDEEKREAAKLFRDDSSDGGFYEGY